MANIHMKEIAQSSIKVILIGFMMVLLTGVLSALGHFLDEQTASTIWTVLGILGLIYIPGFFFLYLWTGYRARKKFRVTTVEAGIATAMAFLVVAIFNFVINIILILAGVEEIITYQITPSLLEINSIFEDYYILDIALCGIAKIIVGVFVNLIIGMCGSIISDERR